ncbi:MAG: phage tail tube protein [Pseudomonadota bacterium]
MQIFGRATITLNGQVLESKDGASIDPGGLTNETSSSDQGHNYAQSLRPAMVKCSIQMTAGLSLADLNDANNVTIQFQCDTGQTYVLANAWRVGDLNATGGSGGGIDLEFHANAASEVGV